MGLCLTVLIADLAKPGYGQFGLRDATDPVLETATRAIAKVEDYVEIKDGTVIVKAVGCKGQPTPGYKGFTAAQWQQFKKEAKGKGIDKAVNMLGGKFCDLADGFVAFPDFAPGKKLTVKKGKNNKLTYDIKGI